MNSGTEDVVPHPSHIGFLVDNRKTVDHLHDRLEWGGYDVMHIEIRHGLYDFYIEAPGGFGIEVRTSADS